MNYHQPVTVFFLFSSLNSIVIEIEIMKTIEMITFSNIRSLKIEFLFPSVLFDISFLVSNP